MTEQQGATLITTAQAIQQQNDGMGARLEAIGTLSGYMFWVLCALLFFAASRRVVR